MPYRHMELYKETFSKLYYIKYTLINHRVRLTEFDMTLLAMVFAEKHHNSLTPPLLFIN